MERPDIERLRKIHEAATEGPWDFQANGGVVDLRAPQHGGTIIMCVLDGSFAFRDGSLLHAAEQFFVPEKGREHHEWFRRIDHPDATAMTEARNALPELLDEIDRLTAERDALRAALVEARQDIVDWASLAIDHASGSRGALKRNLARLDAAIKENNDGV